MDPYNQGQYPYSSTGSGYPSYGPGSGSGSGSGSGFAPQVQSYPFGNLGPAPPLSSQQTQYNDGGGFYAAAPAPPPIGGFSSPYNDTTYGLVTPTPTYPPPVYGTSGSSSSSASSSYYSSASASSPYGQSPYPPQSPSPSLPSAALQPPASQPTYALGGMSGMYGGQQGYLGNPGSVLSPAQLDSYTKAFQIYDRDKDGYISLEELGTALRSLGQACSIPELKELIRSVDHDGDMRINIHEFAMMMASRVALDESNMLRTFKAFDKDKNGRISRQELMEAMASLGQPLTSKQASKMIEMADRDGDGEIDYTDFARMMMSALH